MISKEKKARNRENYQNEEEEYHKHVSHFMWKISTEEILTLSKEVESKLFNISLKKNKEQQSKKSIFSYILRYSVVEKKSEYCS